MLAITRLVSTLNPIGNLSKHLEAISVPSNSPKALPYLIPAGDEVMVLNEN